MPTMFESLTEAGIGSGERIPFAEIEARVHRLRSEAMTNFFGGTVRGLGRGVRAVGRWTVTAMKNASAARAVEQISRLDDATLAELGLRRDALSQQVFACVFGHGTAEPTLAAIPGGKPANGKPDVAAPERRAA